MFFRKRFIRSKRRHHRSHNLSIKYMLQILSSLILPFLLGVFTVYITMDQRRLARIDRKEDKNESRQQRQQEWTIAIMKQDAQNKGANDRYQDEILVAYINKIGDLLKENNGSLTSNHLTATLARVKTLNAFRQLDGSRSMHVLRFLYEAGQLTTTEGSVALDLKGAELNNIEFSQSSWPDSITKISLAGARLQNCTFSESKLLVTVNFGSTFILNVTFSRSELKSIDFSSAEIRDTDLSFAELENVNFSSAKLTMVNFSSAELMRVNFSSAKFNNVNFLRVQFILVNLSSAELTIVDFSSAVISHVNFSSVKLFRVNFSSAALLNVNFSSARLAHINFPSALFFDVTFSSALFANVKFSSAKLNGVDFSSSQLAFGSSHFHYADMTRTKFVKCHCEMANFSYANLSMSEFMDANLKNVSFQNANLTQVNFTLANLWNADLTNTTITDDQLHSALSIRNAKLPNGTLGHARNLIRNGKANCNTRLIDPWHVSNDTILVNTSTENLNNCQFVLKSDINEATMWQRISLADVWDPIIWAYSNVELHLSRSSGISFELNGLDSNGTILWKELSNSTKNEITMELQKNMQQLEVVIKFIVYTEKKYIWCDNIELFINYQMPKKKLENTMGLIPTGIDRFFI